MEECFWQHNYTQKPMAQVKTSTKAMNNGESASIAAIDNDVLWLTTLLLIDVSLSLDDLLSLVTLLLLMTLQLIGASLSLDGFTHSSTSSS